jgi:hypothetical protein
MPTFRINLIRRRPVPLPQRRPLALALLLYLLATGALLAWTVQRATRDVLASRLQARLLDEQCRSFLALRRDGATLDACAAGLRGQLLHADATLAAVERTLRQRIPVAHVLRDLAAPLPADVRLLNIDLNASGRALRFDLAVPVENAPTGATNTAAILAAWRNAPFLKRAAADLRERSSQQADVGGRPVFLLHFEATLQEGG